MEQLEAAVAEASASERFWNRAEECLAVEVTDVYVWYVADLKNVDQTYRITVGLDMEWEASERDLQEWQKGRTARMGYRPEVIPTFEIIDAKESEQIRVEQSHGSPFAVTKTGNNHMRTLVKATCLQSYRLHSFPFDCQDLTITIMSTFNDAERKQVFFVPPRKEGSSFVYMNRRFAENPDFEFKRGLLEFVRKDNSWSEFVVHFQMLRKPQGYLYRIGFSIFLLTIVTASAFSFDVVNEFNDRITYLITLILTFVAFSFVISQQVPQVAYLTILDKYNLSAFTLVVLLLVAVSVLRNIGLGVDEARNVDTILFWVFAALTVILNFSFAIYGFQARQAQLKKLSMNTRELYKVTGKPDAESPIRMTSDDRLNDSDTQMAGDPYISFAKDG